eukprot:6388325-Amphidinium_carterae.1
MQAAHSFANMIAFAVLGVCVCVCLRLQRLHDAPIPWIAQGQQAPGVLFRTPVGAPELHNGWFQHVAAALFRWCPQPITASEPSQPFRARPVPWVVSAELYKKMRQEAWNFQNE